MKLTFILYSLLLVLATSSQTVNVIPIPQKISFNPGTLSLGSSPKNLSLITSSSILKEADSILGEEGYRLEIDSLSVRILSNTAQGFYHGEVTLQQLIQVRYSEDSVSSYSLPCLTIIDYPRYSWRGMELDVCRHFFSKEVIKKYIDLLARLKMNIFHWHLTDDQGWRIEIKKYPRLTEVGAWRKEKDGSLYGGFYTQQDVKEIIEYATERGITIVPEIEMPGHSSAAIAAYPELSCYPKSLKEVPNSWGIFKDIYCPSEFTFHFLQNVLDEVCELFPGRYIHLGGDEAPKVSWRRSTLVQTVKQENLLANEEQVQHYFMSRMENYLNSKGKVAIGWGEVARGGLSDSIVVMSWRGKYAGAKAMRNGNKVIMTPRFFCYFDYPQRINDKKYAWWMTYIPMRKVYKFNPAVRHLSPDRQHLILGGQANVWTEYIQDEERLSYQIMPRLAAMSEVLWTMPKALSKRNFEKRLRWFVSQP